jgi:hypothetical protein
MISDLRRLGSRRYLIVVAVVTAALGVSLLINTATYSAAPQAQALTHKAVTATVFWVGERGSSDNNYIGNVASAWDEQWQGHYGGVDSPNARHGYYPAAFRPRENPFYVALPYDDVNDAGQRRPMAGLCPNVNNPKLKHYSWCKNAWVAVRNGSRTVYAQWEDVGPYQENDIAYVFGTSQPRNHIDTGAGLDVSPAVRDYLRVGGVSRNDWNFVPAQSVPAGPWLQIVTHSPGESID